MKTSSMPSVHPAAELFPMMNPDELAALAADIKINGLQQPVVLYGAQLLDGRNRWRACELAGVEVIVKDWNGKDAVAYVRSLNLHRRHLSPAQRAALAVKAEPVYAEQAKEKQAEGRKKGGQLKGGNHPKAKQQEKGRALAQAAKETGASLDSAKAMKKVQATAPDVVELVQRGQVKTVAEAQRVAALPAEERAEAVADIAGGFTVAGALAEQRAEKKTPFGQIAVAVESVRKNAIALRGSCERLEDLCSRMKITELKTPDFVSAGMALLVARSHLNHAIKLMRGEEIEQ